MNISFQKGASHVFLMWKQYNSMFNVLKQYNIMFRLNPWIMYEIFISKWNGNAKPTDISLMLLAQ